MLLFTVGLSIAAAPSQNLTGYCDYPPVFQQSILADQMWLCDGARLSPTAFTFDLPTSGTITYEGRREGDRLHVDRLVFDPGTSREAAGDCQVDRIAGKPTVVACLAEVDGRFHAVNFVVSGG